MTKDELMAQLDEDDTVYVDAMLDTMAEADALRAKLADAEARVAELEAQVAAYLALVERLLDKAQNSEFDKLLEAYAEAKMYATLYAGQDNPQTAAMWATVAEDHRRKIVAAYAELEAQVAAANAIVANVAPSDGT